jgi:hypothetical protein
MLLPNVLVLKTDILLPPIAQALMETVDAKLTKSNTLKLLPNLI